MSVEKKIAKRADRRAMRTRRSLKGNRPRVSVFRSLRAIYAQVIDDSKHETVASSSSVVLEAPKGGKKEIAFLVGKDLAKKAKEKGITQIEFDRGPFKYHGRVKALAEGLRDGGLEF